ncbi:DUF2793 domain-containing protein [Variovorax sp. RT4R15]|uniref:DUF2793 domain-containing protein n=1 Tax=Variovorax sp. RT4R15 TaxID=3443737 RepID=UPI003F48241E
MSTPILPFAVWASGTNQNSIPANDNSLRHQILNGLLLSKATTAQPGSPTDGDIYIIPAAATGAQWATFDEDDIAIFMGGTWYAFAPSEGVVVNFDGSQEQWTTASGWAAVGGAGSVAAEDVTYDNATSGLVATDVQAAVDELAGLSGATKFVNIALSDMSTDLTTGTAKAQWFAPEDGDLASVYIGVHDPSSSGVVRVDMNDSGGSVFTTRPAIDATEATSITGTAAVLDGTVSFSRGDKFTFDIDDAGTDAKGLQVCVEYTPT